MMVSTSAVFLGLVTTLIAVAILSRNGTADPGSHALGALRTGNTAERRQAIELLVQLGDQRAIRPLAEALRTDEDPLVREMAEQALWSLWHRSGRQEVDARLHAGIAAMQQGALERAVTLFTEVIDLAPDFAEGYNKRATTYYLLQEYEQSLRDCDKTVSLNAFHFGALSGAGLCYVGLRNLPKALEYFERAVAVNPNMPQIQQYIEDIKKFLRDQST